MTERESLQQTAELWRMMITLLPRAKGKPIGDGVHFLKKEAIQYMDFDLTKYTHFCPLCEFTYYAAARCGMCPLKKFWWEHSYEKVGEYWCINDNGPYYRADQALSKGDLKTAEKALWEVIRECERQLKEK